MTKKPLHIWDHVSQFHVLRRPPYHPFFQIERIDPGANYFVLMLEQLGAMPQFSCEGHPNGFYVLFQAPVALALKIKQCGYFSVELEGKNTWSIRTRIGLEDDRERKQLLRWAAQAWEEKLGPLDCDSAAHTAAYGPKSKRKTTKCKR